MLCQCFDVALTGQTAKVLESKEVLALPANGQVQATPEGGGDG